MSATFWEQPVTVRVPATSANLGPGFDCMGLALDLFDDVTAEVISGGTVVSIEGEGATDLPRDDSHLIIASMHRTFAAMEVQPPTVGLHCVNRIPQARGLGSSSAAIVAGAMLARAMVVDGDARMTDQQLLQFVVDQEGHPDNVAPCILGGLVLAWGNPVQTVHRQVHASINALVFVSALGVKTEQARAILPETITHDDATANSARAALLVDALTHDPSNLFDATVDYLHQEQRRSAMPHSLDLMDALRSAGIPATISGAGPSVLVLTTTTDQRAKALEIGDRFLDFQALPIATSPSGAKVVAG